MSESKDIVYCYVVDGRGKQYFSYDGNDMSKGLELTARAMIDAHVEWGIENLEGHVTVNGFGRTLDIDEAQRIVEGKTW